MGPGPGLDALEKRNVSCLSWGIAPRFVGSFQTVAKVETNYLR
jgi:hypothetical protein